MLSKGEVLRRVEPESRALKLTAFCEHRVIVYFERRKWL
jgi:hypothetical protein